MIPRQDPERPSWWLLIFLVLVAILTMVAGARAEVVRVIELVTSVGPTCIPPDQDLAGVAVFRGTPTNTVWIDGDVVL